LFELELLLGREMLEHASATDAEVRALRCDTIGRRVDDAFELRLVEIAIALEDPELDLLARQGITDERDLPVDARNAMTFVREVGDFCGDGRTRPRTRTTRHARSSSPATLPGTPGNAAAAAPRAPCVRAGSPRGIPRTSDGRE